MIAGKKMVCIKKGKEFWDHESYNMINLKFSILLCLSYRSLYVVICIFEWFTLLWQKASLAFTNAFTVLHLQKANTVFTKVAFTERLNQKDSDDFCFLYIWLGNTYVGRNWITNSYNGCYPNNSSSGGNYWQFWKAENKGYKGNKITIKVQNMYSKLIFYLNLWKI